MLDTVWIRVSPKRMETGLSIGLQSRLGKRVMRSGTKDETFGRVSYQPGPKTPHVTVESALGNPFSPGSSNGMRLITIFFSFIYLGFRFSVFFYLFSFRYFYDTTNCTRSCIYKIICLRSSIQIYTILIVTWPEITIIIGTGARTFDYTVGILSSLFNYN